MYAATDRTIATPVFPLVLPDQDFDLPERLIGGDPRPLVDHVFARWGAEPCMLPDAVPSIAAASPPPRRSNASCEDYRAAASIDLVH